MLRNSSLFPLMMDTAVVMGDHVLTLTGINAKEGKENCLRAFLEGSRAASEFAEFRSRYVHPMSTQ